VQVKGIGVAQRWLEIVKRKENEMVVGIEMSLEVLRDTSWVLVMNNKV
jgi:hypothetical protein